MGLWLSRIEQAPPEQKSGIMAGNPIDECSQIQGNLSCEPCGNQDVHHTAILSQALPILSKEGAETSCENFEKTQKHHQSHNITATTYREKQSHYRAFSNFSKVKR